MARVAADVQDAGPCGEQGPLLAARLGARAATRTEEFSGPAVLDPMNSHWRAATVRVLIAIEDSHRVCREAIGEFLQASRPRLQVRGANPQGLHAELRRFGPQVVVYAGPPAPIPDLLPCWVELSLDPARPTVLWAERVRREFASLSAEGLLAVIDEAAPVCP